MARRTVAFVFLLMLPITMAATSPNYIPASCSHLKKSNPQATSGNYSIDPDGAGGLAPFKVYCDMTDPAGVTVISHDSENRTHVQGYEAYGSYSRDIHYNGASLAQLAKLTSVSSRCIQFIKYECHGSMILRQGYGWWVSRNSTKMNDWGGAPPGSGKCECGVYNICADARYGCNCDKNDNVWRQDIGFLDDKTSLPVKQLRFGDTETKYREEGYHTLGKLKCFNWKL